MALTEILALLIGGYGILSAILMVTQPHLLDAIFDGFEDSPALAFSVGAIVFFAGGLLVGHHNLWTGWTDSAVSVVGWVALVKGAVFIIAPTILPSIARPILRFRIITRVFAFITVGFGLSLVIPQFL